MEWEGIADAIRRTGKCDGLTAEGVAQGFAAAGVAGVEPARRAELAAAVVVEATNHGDPRIRNPVAWIAGALGRAARAERQGSGAGAGMGNQNRGGAWGGDPEAGLNMREKAERLRGPPADRM